MFAKTIIDSDAFIDMPVTARLLYYDLGMRADDDGFVNSPKKIMRMVGASQDDLAILISKKFIIPFDSGVVVIKHWRIHNYIQKDRYKETKYKDEKAMLIVKENDGYSLKGNTEQPQIEETTDRQQAYKESELPYSFDYKIRLYFVGKPCPICGKPMTYENNLSQPTIQHNIPISKGGRHEIGNISVICRSCNTSIKDNPTDKLNADEVASAWDEICIQNVSDSDTQVRLGKVRKGKDRVNIPPTLEEVSAYCEERHNNIDPQVFIDFYESKGWMVGKNKMKDWKACIRTWEKSDRKHTLDHVVIDRPSYMGTGYDPEAFK